MQISGQTLASTDQKEFGSATITWEADFQNQCDTYVDVDVTVDLVDDAGKSLYTLTSVESFGYREERRVRDQVYVPGDVADRAKKVEIEIEERERL